MVWNWIKRPPAPSINSFKSSCDLPILWPTGVEKGFPIRNSIVSPSENILENYERPLYVTVIWQNYWAQNGLVSLRFRCVPLRGARALRRSRENTHRARKRLIATQAHEHYLITLSFKYQVHQTLNLTICLVIRSIIFFVFVCLFFILILTP